MTQPDIRNEGCTIPKAADDKQTIWKIGGFAANA